MAYLNGKHIPIVMRSVTGETGGVYVVDFQRTYTDEQEQQIIRLANKLTINPETNILMHITDETGANAYIPASISLEGGFVYFYAVDEEMKAGYSVYTGESSGEKIVASRKDTIPEKSSFISSISTNNELATAKAVYDYINSLDARGVTY